MAVPVELRATAIAAAFERFTDVETPLARFFPMVPNPNPGPHVSYDVLAYSRERPEVNVRGGPPIFVEPPTETVVNYMAETWSDGQHVTAQTLKDLREPGQAVQNRGRRELARREKTLRLRWERFLEWMRAEALVGIKTYKPLGSDTEITELLLCSTSCLIPTVTAAWNTASATEAAARTNLEAIRADFELAHIAIAAAGCVCGGVLMNSITRGYLDTQAIAAGYEMFAQMVVMDGGLKKFADTPIIIDDETYVHPLTVAVTKYIPDSVAIFLDLNNDRAGRMMRECEAVDTHAPAGHIGMFLRSWEIEPMPGGIDIAGEWTGGPEINVACSQYVFQDVTAEP